MGTGRYARASRILAGIVCAPLLWLLLVWLAWIPIARVQRVLATALLGQAFLLQLVGDYYW